MDKYGYYKNDYENISNVINSINDMSSDNIFRYKMILQKLVEQATPKKVKRSIDKRTVNEGLATRNDKCPNCNIFIPFKVVKYRDTVKGLSKYCWNCGQALDWSE